MSKTYSVLATAPVACHTSRPRAALRLVAALAFVCAGSLDARAATPQCQFPAPWTRTGVATARGGGPLSPLLIAADPSVIHDGPLYKMWFTNANSLGQTGIAMATSTDGLVWDVYRNPVNPDPLMDLVLTAPAGAWDSPGIETAHVLRAPDGSYRMYYAGDHLPQGSVTYAIGLATSPDGVHWTRRAQPVLEASNAWELPTCTTPGNPNTCSNGGVLEPSVLYDAASQQYRMWYVGLGTPANSFLSFRIGYAVSSDGITWQRRATPVMTLGASGAWDEMWTSHVEVVADPRAGFHMFYFGSAMKDYRDGVEMQRGSVGHAYSPDGINWQRDPANPILAPGALAVDAWSVGGPSVLIEGNHVNLWYFGNPTLGIASSIVLAGASCGP